MYYYIIPKYNTKAILGSSVMLNNIQLFSTIYQALTFNFPNENNLLKIKSLQVYITEIENINILNVIKYPIEMTLLYYFDWFENNPFDQKHKKIIMDNWKRDNLRL
jgi:hypothetical protein